MEVRPVQSTAKTKEELKTEVSALREQMAALRSRTEYPQRSKKQDCDTSGHIEQKKEQRTGGSRSPFLRVETAGEVVRMLLDTGADISLIA